jgi:hypothetical protein
MADLTCDALAGAGPYKGWLGQNGHCSQQWEGIGIMQLMRLQTMSVLLL